MNKITFKYQANKFKEIVPFNEINARDMILEDCVMEMALKYLTKYFPTMLQNLHLTHLLVDKKISVEGFLYGTKFRSLELHIIVEGYGTFAKIYRKPSGPIMIYTGEDQREEECDKVLKMLYNYAVNVAIFNK